MQCCAVIVEALVHVDALLQVLLEQQNLPIPCCREEGHNVPPPRSRQGWPTAASRRVSGRAFGRRMSKGRTRSNYRVVRLVSSLTPHLTKAPLLLDFLNHFPTVEKPSVHSAVGPRVRQGWCSSSPRWCHVCGCRRTCLGIPHRTSPYRRANITLMQWRALQISRPRLAARPESTERYACERVYARCGCMCGWGGEGVCMREMCVCVCVYSAFVH